METKAIIISIKPRHCANILNGIKKEEIRTTCLKEWKDYLSGKTKVKPKPRAVYIYCCYGETLSKGRRENILTPDGKLIINKPRILNGQVIAKFTLDKVARQYMLGKVVVSDKNDFLKNACLTSEELNKYLGYGKTEYMYAWHIDNLEIFDKPKKLGEFYIRKPYKDINKMLTDEKCINNVWVRPLTKAPQSWCYVVPDAKY